MTEKIYLETFEKCPVSVYFPLLLQTSSLLIFKAYVRPSGQLRKYPKNVKKKLTKYSLTTTEVLVNVDGCVLT